MIRKRINFFPDGSDMESPSEQLLVKKLKINKHPFDYLKDLWTDKYHQKYYTKGDFLNDFVDYYNSPEGSDYAFDYNIVDYNQKNGRNDKPLSVLSDEYKCYELINPLIVKAAARCFEDTLSLFDYIKPAVEKIVDQGMDLVEQYRKEEILNYISVIMSEKLLLVKTKQNKRFYYNHTDVIRLLIAKFNNNDFLNLCMNCYNYNVELTKIAKKEFDKIGVYFIERNYKNEDLYKYKLIH